jgi:4'-phosphopantetheinyl transferase
MSESGTVWKSPPSGYSLPSDEVHIWRAGLDWPPEAVDEWCRILPPEERKRADAFHFPADRTRHILGRAVSRLLIARCAGVEAASVRFEYGAKGKPQLAGALIHNSLNFNISHSGDYVLVAIAFQRCLGVDIERIRMDIDTGAIAKRFFSANECLALAGLPADLRHEAFFACWTRKEAYIKARGDGLSLGLHRFDVAFLPGQEPRLLETRHDPADASRWTLRDIDVGTSHKAALAAQGSEFRLQCWDWLA